MGISSHNIIHNMSEEEIEKPFNAKKFQDDLRSIVPGYDENHNILSESSGHSESSQSDYDDLSEQRQVSVKKRGREQEEIDVSGLTVLPREKVLKLTSKEIEDYVSRLKQNHVLTQSEEKDLKKQRRLVKNREYASQSRSRRKVYVENIESKLQKTNQDCMSIKTQLNQVKEENKMLKKQLYSIVSTLKSDSSLAQAFGKLFAPLGNNKPSSTTTLFIFIFLFSFTFLFKSPISFNSPSSTITFNSDSASLQRNLLEFDEPTAAPSSEWKRAILEETKQYIDNLVDSVYSNIRFKEVSETKLNTETFLPIDSKENNTTDKKQVETTITADDEITNIFGKVSLDDAEPEKCKNNENTFDDFKETLRSNSPPLTQ
ncbi:hypothetical protein DICPUDRAFT_93022 [Dictyostelium purpureum]|uniref:BZIP domain-containing protein n=1 Tax=Dictyostelium purpureum TaxID=5786 RepID=F1A0U3_DICPU|nr:uncharacterized protein DICPUDRAFT_93022 [Dictyostelium purpureum]EGC30180.1 hypothetical protein DICPUDRAFT_93022 [Dictyostelium purpureum]|eukprot:XP_003293287.1 hypothetical protein DICPUDRAFT_93022 [Dictyostelium purpureum]